MTAMSIIEYPDERLRNQSAPVTEFDREFNDSIDRLIETFYATGGIGLSAPQVGDFRRIVVMDLSDDHTATQVFINPEIIARERDAWVEESCLSVPGTVGNVIRATRIRVRALDRTGQPFERDLEDMHAVCLQHELDHLDGQLFVDRLPLLKRWAFRLSSRHRKRSAGTTLQPDAA